MVLNSSSPIMSQQTHVVLRMDRQYLASRASLQIRRAQLIVNQADIKLLPYSAPKTGCRAIGRQGICSSHVPSRNSHQPSLHSPSSLSCRLLQAKQAVTIAPMTPPPITMETL